MNKGDTVTIIEAFDLNYPVGSVLTIIEARKSGVLTLVTPKIYLQYLAESKGLKGKKLKEKTQEFIDRFGFQVLDSEVEGDWLCYEQMNLKT